MMKWENIAEQTYQLEWPDGTKLVRYRDTICSLSAPADRIARAIVEMAAEAAAADKE